MAKTEISAEKAAKKKAKANFKVWGTRILVFTLAALFIISTLIAVIPAFFAL
ncbi:MAG: hypothetical protein ACOYIO_07975 [Eubacteriales bacterium]